jgi:hypothetical protein
MRKAKVTQAVDSVKPRPRTDMDLSGLAVTRG